MQANITKKATIGGLSKQQTKTIEGQSALVKEVTVAKAVTGVLTTRTSNTAGVITMDAAPLFTTANLIDLYFTGGVQRGCTVSSIVGTAVTFTGGVGTNLPAASSALTVAVVQTAVLQFVGNSMLAFALYTEQHGVIDLQNSTPLSVLATGEFASGAAELGSGVCYVWHNTDGTPNPLAGATVASVNFSHDDTVAAHKMSVQALLNY